MTRELPDFAVVKANVFTGAAEPAAAELVARLNAEVTEFDVDRAMPTYSNIMPRGWNKGTAVAWLAERLGVGLDDVVVFGDADNDLPMLRAVPNSVTVAGASPEVAAVSRWHIGACEDDAVAAAIEGARGGGVAVFRVVSAGGPCAPVILPTVRPPEMTGTYGWRMWTPYTEPMSEPADSPRVLVVEDDAALSEVVCTFLGDEGYVCVPAFSGTEALLLAERAGEKNQPLDLVILDLMLPGLPGDELVGRLRTAGVTAPVIVTSATLRRDRPREPAAPGCERLSGQALRPGRAARTRGGPAA